MKQETIAEQLKKLNFDTDKLVTIWASPLVRAKLHTQGQYGDSTDDILRRVPRL